MDYLIFITICHLTAILMSNELLYAFSKGHITTDYYYMDKISAREIEDSKEKD